MICLTRRAGTQVIAPPPCSSLAATAPLLKARFASALPHGSKHADLFVSNPVDGMLCFDLISGLVN
jgi:hypothetical protein